MSPSQATPSLCCRPGTTPSSRGTRRNGTPSGVAISSPAEAGNALSSRYKRVLDKSTGKHYYYDVDTKETFWTLADGPASIPLRTTSQGPRQQRKTYGVPPTEVEAIAQNEGAIVWWKPPSSAPGRQNPQQTGKRNSRLKESNTMGRGVNGKTDEGRRGVQSFEGGGRREGITDEVVESSAIPEEDATPETIGFVVYRYRLDGREWHKKGATNVEGGKAESGTIKALSNGLVYRFTVASRTTEGDSAESKPSVAIRPNVPLPEGWKEKFNAFTGKSVYKNVKTGQSSLERPESNPYFVETDLFLKFTPEETEALAEEFKTKADMQTSALVAIDDIMDILPRIGEPLREVEVVKRLKEEGWEGAADASARDIASVTYRQFLAFLWGIKGPKSTRVPLGRRLWGAIVARVTPRRVSAKKLALIEQDRGKRMGNWEKLVHPIARRAYFINNDNGQASWTVPAEVKFFLNENLRSDLLKGTFSEEDIAGLQRAFAMMDLDGNGTIDAEELGMVLKSFGEAVPPGRVKALMREVDRDGSDCIDFEEFIVMMSAVHKGTASLGWGRINRHLQAEDRVQFDSLKRQFQGIKIRQKTSAALSGGANHGKFCLCGCRGIDPTNQSKHKTVYKDRRTRRLHPVAK